MELNREEIIKSWEDEVALGKEIGLKRDFINYVSISLVNKTLALIKELTEVNERLRAEEKQSQILIKTLHDKLDEGYAKFVDEERADTVRKMQEALDHRIHSKLSYHGWYLKETIFPQITKELLESSKE